MVSRYFSFYGPVSGLLSTLFWQQQEALDSANSLINRLFTASPASNRQVFSPQVGAKVSVKVKKILVLHWLAGSKPTTKAMAVICMWTRWPKRLGPRENGFGGGSLTSYPSSRFNRCDDWGWLFCDCCVFLNVLCGEKRSLELVTFISQQSHRCWAQFLVQFTCVPQLFSRKSNVMTELLFFI